MKHGKILSMIASLLILSGCGHSVLLETEVTGFGMNIPVSEGGASLGIVVGMSKCTLATVRGGTTLETTSSAGGGIFSGDGGINKITTFKTNQQLNEGNFRKVMVSPDVPDEAKIILASNMCVAAKSPKVAQTVLQTKTTSIHTGEATATNAVAPIETVSGVDRIVDRIPEVVVPVVHDTTDIVNNTVNKAEEAVKDASKTTSKTFIDFFRPLKGTKWMLFALIVIGGILATIIIIFVVGWFVSLIKAFINRKKKTTSSSMSHSNASTTKDEPIQTDTPRFSYGDGFIPDRTEEIQKNDVMKKPGIWERIKIVASVIKSLFSHIPPGVKKQLMELIVSWMKNKTESMKKKDNQKK